VARSAAHRGTLSRVELGLRFVLGSLVVAAAGCYRPSIEPCKLACSTAGTCPGELVCNAGMCVASMSDVCSAGDGGLADARPDSSCGWPNITNLDPCMLNVDGATETWTVDGSWVVNTSATPPTATGAGAVVPVVVVDQTLADPSLPTVALIRVKNLDVQTNGLITVQGERPLVILVGDSATIRGTIRVLPASFECASPGGDAPMSLAGTGGGGGGGLGVNDHGTAGAAGGRGGAASGTAGGTPGTSGMAVADPAALALSPLRQGCPGGRGGRDSVMLPENRGPGGGAIQISARTRISIVSGTIEAGGGGGLPGPQGGAEGTRTHFGGGGGGSGGAILLEAPSVNLDAAQLCANGGGGGGSSENLYESGTRGGCSTAGAPGGGVGSGYGPYGVGGNGATAIANATPGSEGREGNLIATAAGSGSRTDAGGGGGGGGGVGRIRINGVVTANESTLSTPRYINE
jgi:hypothetical protein